jgi:hypothetical protein
MAKDRRDLAQQLFAAALAGLEDATEIATAAQASSVPRAKMARFAERLQQAAQAIGMVAATAGIVARARPKKSRSSRSITR